ncbi:thiamine pyrophosphate-dependent dehydrogenase E1 component subunit alpha [Agromyces aerolatus]|uniref:thiamine pyrophosphate-dependent dehydrogenase E1 component subunit alpha n=1 Tax=Agromyces sp. LY-1074 TaxID=3074080 RepID=UPI00285E543F|nr:MULTISPECIES: thiamine pyrophosphate-dependent enzyme [unclassified Agromyces]MDR5701875.1 thiamine pyrophosphate-dependent enzyme [Agromyces sp. LY-1074]MDR5708111.1 thiamine pyrophosphate-dependent enzyme [Agromyces sp. LY-1358]
MSRTTELLAPELTPELTPELSPIRFIDADGELTPAGRQHRFDVDLARDLYRDMVLARALDREAVSLQRQGELGLWLQCEGQEAAQVGSVKALADRDHIFPSYREHAVGLVRGLTPGELLAQWRGVAHAGWDPFEHNLHFYSLVLGTQALHAAGYALGCRLEGSDVVTVAYFGDGAASQGDVNEAFNWAATMELPLLFICQNNQWAISTPTSKQSGTPLHQRAAGFGLRSWWVDGNDALAMHAVTREAVESVRAGQGPALIEAETYRIGGHSTSDDPKRYRTPDELEAWTHRDPIRRLRRVLERGRVDDAWFAETDAAAAALAVRTREECKALAAPDLADLFAEVYADPHPVERERSEYEAFVRLVEGER